jgi:hypothetical protein
VAYRGKRNEERGKSNEANLLVSPFSFLVAPDGVNAVSLFEMVRFHGAGLVVTAQSYAGLGADADRILGAAAGLIVHHCTDPERLLPRD